MREQIISFETAKLAKLKGFDWHTLESYTEEETLDDYGVEGGYYPYNTEQGGTNYAASTQSLLQKWLREVHRIHVIIKPWINIDHDDRYTATLLRDGVEGKWDPKCKDRDTLEESPFNFEEDTFEEALELALLRALRLIK